MLTNLALQKALEGKFQLKEVYHTQENTGINNLRPANLKRGNTPNNNDSNSIKTTGITNVIHWHLSTSVVSIHQQKDTEFAKRDPFFCSIQETHLNIKNRIDITSG